VRPRTQSPATEPQTPGDSQLPGAAPSPEKKPAEDAEQTAAKKDDKEKKHHHGALVVAPLPIVSPAIGSGIIPVAGYIFPFQEKDKVSPPSVVGAAGLITNNGSRGFALGADLYMKENRYELKAAYFHGNVDYNLYGVGYENGNAGLKLPLEQAGQLFFIEFLRNIGWKIFVGGRFITGNSLLTIRPTSSETPPVPPDIGLTTNLRALGMEIVRDTRPNRFYPIKGSLVDFTGDFFAQNLGSKYSFQSYRVTFNKYWSLSDSRFWPTTASFAARVASLPFMAIASTGRTMSCVATLRGVTSIATCLPLNWNIAWSSRGVWAWLPLAASAKLLPTETASAPISSCPPEAPAFVFC
jgi:hypothetical protein